jgi:biotin-(acetyl-CoA carboxylase) ligase
VGLVPLAAGVAVAEVAAESGVVAEVKWPNDILVRGRKLAGVLTESSSSSGRVDWVVVGIGVNVAVAPATSPGSVHDTATSPVSLERPATSSHSVDRSATSRERVERPATSSHSVDRSATSRDHVDHTATSPVSLERSATSRERVEQSATSLDREGDRTPAVEDVAAGVLARLVVWYDALETRPSSVVEAWRQRAVPWWGSPVEVRTVRGGVRGSLRGVDESGALLVDREDGTVERVLSGEVTRLRAVAPERRET